MTVREVELAASDRLIVFAPHPDDESLACGGLIQRAVHLGAAVMVVIATGGDANPWPQRLVEQRWRIDATASARWALRRRNEAETALSLLGVDARNTRFLGWQDQGLTARLMENGEASAGRLRDILLQFKPTIIALPSHLDSHPDHSALALLLRAAIATVASSAKCLTYWLHGRQAGFAPTLQLTLTGPEVSTKRAATLAHVSQTHFGTSRLLRFVGQAEQFVEHKPVASRARDTWHWEFVANGFFNRIAIRRMRVVAISDEGTLQATTYPLRPDTRTGLALRRRGLLRLEATISVPWSTPTWLFAKLESQHGLFVYDAMGWTETRLIDGDPATDAFSGWPSEPATPFARTEVMEVATTTDS